MGKTPKAVAQNTKDKAKRTTKARKAGFEGAEQVDELLVGAAFHSCRDLARQYRIDLTTAFVLDSAAKLADEGTKFDVADPDYPSALCERIEQDLTARIDRFLAAQEGSLTFAPVHSNPASGSGVTVTAPAQPNITKTATLGTSKSSAKVTVGAPPDVRMPASPDSALPSQESTEQRCHLATRIA